MLQVRRVEAICGASAVPVELLAEVRKYKMTWGFGARNP